MPGTDLFQGMESAIGETEAVPVGHNASRGTDLGICR